MSVEVAKHIFTVTEYERMGEAGILAADARVELIEGEIIEMSPIGSRHAACVKRLSALFNRRLGQTVVVSVQDPIVLNEYSAPQPDVVLLKPRTDFYEKAHPTVDDALLIVEVADTTLQYDRQIKLPMYARAGVREVWIVNLTDERVEIYADPSGETYQSTNIRTRGEELQPRAFENLRLGASDIFG